ncbi:MULTISPECIES: flagellar biosynthesis protein FlhB [Enterobacteriaceae]|jgi:flagellar biosynthetic protein FlhB|uniref:flagellar biosynthesis protein FlhB n=1 Tax=Enterobacteriaceae TaxID=543 RepID=UPI0011A1109D|nr:MULTISPECIES: flagellar biosynthesis protein FlhB [Enterobacteriaceae]MCR4456420.1 flagellar biosynthesis protein FlhB [Pseudescherichia sp. L3]MDF2776590.1 lfhB [Enterobacteriaceae bacterium]WPO94407.1 flagellar biosynthesis protein FlhB [Buttiauxella sp. HR94]
MAEAASGEKTEKPSAQKRRKARQEGQLPRSKDMGLAASLLAAFIVVSNSFPWYRDFVHEAFLTVRQYGQRIDDPDILGQFLQHNLLILLKFILTLTPIPLAALIASLIPGGWIFSLKKIAPDLSKISPLKGIGRLFSSEQVIEVGKMMIKSGLVLLLLTVSLHRYFPALLDLQARYFTPAVHEGLSLYQDVMLNVVMLFILFAILDVPLAKYMFTKGLKMTKQEVKDEYKNQEGSPEIKARVRRLQRQMALGQIRRVVPKADVVIANPTHFAVALQYDRARAAAPYVVAKGTDEVARYIREVAREHRVEVVEFPKLARAVYYTTQINQQIPYQLFRAIAHVLTYVLQLKSWRAGIQDRPALNRHISIPKEVLKQDAETD